MYILTGKFLYEDSPMRALFKLGHFQTYEIQDPGHELSEQAKDFIMRLLLRNPDDRMTLDEALNHPWLNNSDPSNLPLRISHANYQAYIN